jgi:hypothetical protein
MKETDAPENDREIKRVKCGKILRFSKLSKRINYKDNASALPIAPVHLPFARDCYSKSLCHLSGPDRVLNRASTTRLRLWSGRGEDTVLQ